MPQHSHSLIELDRVTRVFYTEEMETFALADIDLRIDTGEFVAVVTLLDGRVQQGGPGWR